MTTSMPFIYDELPGEQSMRFLTLFPGTGDQPLRCSLQTANLDNAPQFEAISYVWGTADRNVSISCGDGTVLVTKNLSLALRQVRPADRPRILWADSICINQDNIDERSQQVTLMGRIYSTASCTLICFGTYDAGHAERAASLITQIGTMVEEGAKAVNYTPGGFPWPDMKDTLLSDERWSSFFMLCRHPWFGRGWVVQEAGLTPRAVILWARASIDWSTMMATILWMVTRLPSHPFEAKLNSREFESCELHFWAYGLQKSHKAMVATLFPAAMDDFTPLDIFYVGRSLQVKEPADRVFAFLGLVEHIMKHRLQLEPNYKQPYLKTYQDLTTALFRSFNDLIFLHYVDHVEDDIPGAETCPSWVPRLDKWKTSVRLGDITNEKIKSSFDTPEYSELIHGDRLRVRGLIIDTVASVFEPKCDPLLMTSGDVSQLWNDMRSAQKGFAYSEGTLSLAFLEAISLSMVRGREDIWTASKTAYRRQLAIAGADGIADDTPNGTPSHDDSTDRTKGEPESFHAWIRKCFQGRALVVMKRGHIGLAPIGTRRGDLCSIIFGTRSPFIMRASDAQGEFKLLGEAHVPSKSLVAEPGKELCSFKRLGEHGHQDWLEWKAEERDLIVC